MKFRALPITSLEDVTLDLEQLQALDVLDLTAESVLQLLTPGTKATRLTSGTGTVTFTAASNTPAVNVSHGLGVTPQRFWTEPTSGFSAAFWMQTDVVAHWTASIVPVAGFCYTAISATVTFQWFAIG